MVTYGGSTALLHRGFSKELKQRGQRRQLERQKKAMGLDWQNNNFARAPPFFVHFLAVTARLPRENV